jgi:hypothetical protein
MPTTAQQLITKSLQTLGVVSPGQTPSAEELADGLYALNQLLSAWSIERLNIYAEKRELLTLVDATAVYTIGIVSPPSADPKHFNTTRPVAIKAANAIVSGLTLPMDVVTLEEWSAITDKAASSLVPKKLYNDNAHPVSTLRLWPVPDGTPSLELFTWQQFTGFATLDTAVDLPPGYEVALRYNLAVDIAPDYDLQPSETVVALANKYKAAISGLNAPPVPGAAAEAAAKATVAQASTPQVQ